MEVTTNPYIDPDNPCVAVRMFNDLFECGVPTLALYSPKVLSEGFIMPGATEQDRNSELRTVRRLFLPVAAMIEFMIEGFDITFYNYETMLKVYQLSTKHLDNWLYISQDTNAVRFPPINELQTIEQLAIYMHNHLVNNGYGDQLNTNAVEVRFTPMLSIRARLAAVEMNERLALTPKKYVYRPRVPTIIERKNNGYGGYTTNTNMARSY